MITIYKYPFQIFDMVPLKVPAGSTPLCVQMQNDEPCIWMLVDTTKPIVFRALKIFGTGREIIDDVESLSYVGTIQMSHFVWHVFLRDQDGPLTTDH
jgi:hypothetical protein